MHGLRSRPARRRRKSQRKEREETEETPRFVGHTRESLEKLTRRELQDLAKQKKIPANKKSEQIINELLKKANLEISAAGPSRIGSEDNVHATANEEARSGMIAAPSTSKSGSTKKRKVQLEIENNEGSITLQNPTSENQIRRPATPNSANSPSVVNEKVRELSPLSPAPSVKDEPDPDMPAGAKEDQQRSNTGSPSSRGSDKENQTPQPEGHEYNSEASEKENQPVTPVTPYGRSLRNGLWVAVNPSQQDSFDSDSDSSQQSLPAFRPEETEALNQPFEGDPCAWDDDDPITDPTHPLHFPALVPRRSMSRPLPADRRSPGANASLPLATSPALAGDRASCPRLNDHQINWASSLVNDRGRSPVPVSESPPPKQGPTKKDTRAIRRDLTRLVDETADIREQIKTEGHLAQAVAEDIRKAKEDLKKAVWTIYSIEENILGEMKRDRTIWDGTGFVKGKGKRERRRQWFREQRKRMQVDDDEQDDEEGEEEEPRGIKRSRDDEGEHETEDQREASEDDLEDFYV